MYLHTKDLKPSGGNSAVAPNLTSRPVGKQDLCLHLMVDELKPPLKLKLFSYYHL